MLENNFFGYFISLLLALTVTLNYAEYPTWNQDGCSALSNNDFVEVPLVRYNDDQDLNEPLKMAFDMDAQMNVDVYFVQRSGEIRKYQASNGSLHTLTRLNVFTGHEQGAVGIALDPDFKNNGFIYILYSPSNTTTQRLSRFTVSGNSIDQNSQIIMIDIPNNRDICCHTGGGMQFDDYGDLWITIGNNSGNGNGSFVNETSKNRSDEWGASSTAGMRGGILRIHPESDGTYTIPPGNFGEHFAAYWRDQGEEALAAEYEDPTKVFPEIWLKGTRNAFTLTLDPYRRWAMWGDIGPDFNGLTDEFNLATEPQFAGWPYWAGANVVNTHIDQNLRETDPANPINNSQWNNGVTRLPPAIPSVGPERQGAAVTGPLYRYDGDLQSDVKFPPHFNRHLFISEFNRDWIRAIPVSEDGQNLQGVSNDLSGDSKFNVLTHINVKAPLDFQAGPDGALYILNYGKTWYTSDGNTGISRIEYRGTCRPPEPKLEKNVSLKSPARAISSIQVGQIISSRRFILGPGQMQARVYDLTGKKVFEYQRSQEEGALRVDLPPSIPLGVYQIRFE